MIKTLTKYVFVILYEKCVASFSLTPPPKVQPTPHSRAPWKGLQGSFRFPGIGSQSDCTHNYGAYVFLKKEICFYLGKIK